MLLEAKGKRAQTIITEPVIIDSVVITSFIIQTYPIGSEKMVIQYASGYYEGTEFIPRGNHQVQVEGVDMHQIMTMQPDTSNGLYAALEQILGNEIDKDMLG